MSQSSLRSIALKGLLAVPFMMVGCGETAPAPSTTPAPAGPSSPDPKVPAPKVEEKKEEKKAEAKK